MDNILICGENSYIGNHIKSWLESQNPGQYNVSKISVRNDEWSVLGFGQYDVIIHVAGIVHRQPPPAWEVYQKVNIELPVRVATKAKSEGVRQFIFISSMAVYGKRKCIEGTIITKETKESPVDYYGRSKYKAEIELRELANEDFLITIVRPPNVYGPKCPGNYISRLSSAVRYLPAIPLAYEDVKQSMIFVDNLTEFVKILIDEKKDGTFMPQDAYAVSAVESK